MSILNVDGDAIEDDDDDDDGVGEDDLDVGIVGNNDGMLVGSAVGKSVGCFDCACACVDKDRLSVYFVETDSSSVPWQRKKWTGGKKERSREQNCVVKMFLLSTIVWYKMIWEEY